MKQEEFNNYANSFQAIARLRLESIERLLEHLGNPHKKLQCIHVAGTNGKGSVSAFLQCMLSASKKRCGKYISPNLVSVCERISVDGVQITEEELSALLFLVRDAAKKTEEELGDSPTQFEIWTAAAFLYFAKKNCDVVVLETGLGGRCDATNIIPPPAVSVITHIAMDHMQYLGNTLSEIAYEKAGIIKRHPEGGGCTVSARQSPEAADVLFRVCRERENRLICAKEPISVSYGTDGEVFDYGDLKGLRCSMLGLHQLDNAAAAIETAKYLGLPEESIREGLLLAKNPARFDIVSENPLILFDGAHNPDGMRALSNGLSRYFSDKTKAFVMASMQDKDISASLDILKAVSGLKKIYTVSVKDNPRAMSAPELAKIVRAAGFSAEACQSVSEALKKCGADMTVICGSLYLYKDFCER